MKQKIKSFIYIAIIGFCLFQSCSAFQLKADTSITSKIIQFQEQAIKLGDSWDREKIDEAISLYLKLSEISQKKTVDKKTSFYLREASFLKFILGDSKSAILYLEKSLTLDKIGKNVESEAESLAQFSYIHSNLGNYEESNKSLLKILQLIPKIKSIETKANVYYFLGEIYYMRQDIPQFLKYYTQALQLYKTINNKRGVAKTLLSISYAYLAKDDVKNGLAYSKEAIDKWVEIENKRGEALSIVVMGLAYFRLGLTTEALTYFNKAKQLFPLDIDKTERAILISNIGRVYASISDCKQAISNLKQAVDIFNEENNLSYAMGNLTTLGSVSYQCGYKNEALTYLQQSLRIAKLTKSYHDIMYVHTELAQLYSNENLFAKSEANYRQALKVLKINNYQFDKSRALSGLGKLFLKSNNPKLALKNQMESLEINSKIKDKFSTAETLFELAKINSILKDIELSLDYSKKSIEVTETIYSDVANTILKRSYFSNVYDRYELYINLLMQKQKELPTEDFETKALQASEQARSRSLLETLRLSEANFTKDANPELVQHEKETRNLLSLKSDKLTDLLSSNSDKTEVEKVEDEIRILENDLENVKAELKQNSPIYSAIKNPPPFEVAEFQQNILDERTLLLEFSLGENESYLWLIGKNEVTHYILPARNIIESRIDKIRQTFENRQKSPDKEIEVYQKRINDLEYTFNQEAKVLSNELLGQIVEKIRDKRLIVVPDGKLQYLPLSALPFPNSDEPLIQHNELVYEPSASLLNLLAKTQAKKLPTKDLIVFADPVFNNSDNRLISKNENENSLSPILGLNLRDFQIIDGNGKIPRLFASQDEADAIQKVVGKSRSVIASGFEASRNRVLNSDISDYRILHFATHGLVDVERPEISSIVLSQFDKNGDKSEGFLRLQDIYSLDLVSDLVVLSACQSGIGKEIKGEGLMSLNSAFLQAGAKSVLSSSWKVDDYATAELMKYFYQGLIDKQLPPAEALRQAQLKMRQNPQFSSPFYWAAFTLQGEFRHPVSIGNSNFYYYSAFIILGVFLLAIGFKYKFYRTAKL